MKEYLKNYLKPFIGKIVFSNQYDKWKNERDKYIYTGLDSDKQLRSILPNEIILEFDHNKEGKENPVEAKQEALKWHNLAKEYIQSLNIGFHITDHDGKSPHIRFQVYGLDILPHETRVIYKEQIVNQILKEINYCGKYTHPDRGLITREHGLVSLELSPHFKPEHNGKIEEITYICDKQLLTPNPKQIKLIQENLKKEVKTINQIQIKDINQIKLKEWFKKYYTEGYMNNTDLAFFGMCKKTGLRIDEAEQLYIGFISDLGYEYDYKRRKRLDSTYQCSNPGVFVYLADREDTLESPVSELYNCFKIFDKNLISAEDIINMDIPPIEWDIEGMITTNGYHFLAGMAGKFKTYLSFFMARSFITGEDFLGRKVKKRNVLLVDEESRERTLKERTLKVLSDLTTEERQRFKFSISKGIKFTVKNIPQLEEDIKNSKAEVVFMDSFSRFFVGNENSSDDVKLSYELLKPLMEKYKCSFIIIHHFNKNNTNNMNSLRGSSDLSAQCDTIIVINEEFKNNYSVWLEKNRHGEKGKKICFKVVDSDDNQHLLLDYVGEKSVEKKTQTEKNADILYNYLIKEKITSFSLSNYIIIFEKLLGVKYASIQIIRKEMVDTGKLEYLGKGTYKVIEDSNFEEII